MNIKFTFSRWASPISNHFKKQFEYNKEATVLGNVYICLMVPIMLILIAIGYICLEDIIKYGINW